MTEVYEGRKFRTVFHGRDLVADERIPALIACGRRFAELGLAEANNGYLALRSPLGMTIKTGGASLGALSHGTFATVLDYDPVHHVVVAQGPAEPSSESAMAWMVFRHRPEVGAIVHVHAPAPEAPDDPGTLPEGLSVTGAEAEYGTLDIAKQCLRGLRDGHTVWLRDHGYVTVGRDLAMAEARFRTHLSALHPERFGDLPARPEAPA